MIFAVSFVVCLCVVAVEEMDKNDEELRESITKLWPIQGPTMHMILVPPNEGSIACFATAVCRLVKALFTVVTAMR